MLSNIHALRGLSSVLVVLVHLTGSEGTLAIPRIGQGGVDIFFIISGFLMVYINRVRRLTPWAFFTQRLARVAPFYWIMTLAVFCVALARPTLLAATTASPGELVRSLLFIPFMKSNGLIQPTLFVGWTLNYEMFFYAVFAIGLIAKNGRTGFAITGGFLLSLTLAGVVFTPEATAFRFYADPILLEFLAGMAIALCIGPSYRVSGDGARLLMVGVALAAIAILLIGPVVSFWPPVLLCGLPAAILVAVAVVLEQSGSRLRTPLLMRLGDASFAIYLTHPFVIQLVKLVWGHGQGSSWSTFALCVVGAVGIGDLAHRWVERPVSRLGLRIVRREPARVFIRTKAALGDGKLGG